MTVLESRAPVTQGEEEVPCSLADALPARVRGLALVPAAHGLRRPLVFALDHAGARVRERGDDDALRFRKPQQGMS